MSPRRDISPEKRLLQIIEEQQDKPPARYPRGRRFAISWRLPRVRIESGFDLRRFNRLLQVLVCVLALAVGYGVRQSIVQLNAQTMIPPARPVPLGARSEDTIQSLLQSRQFYLDTAAQRDLFALADVEMLKPAFEEKAPEENSTAFVELVKGLKLVGISWSNEPDAIIESTSAQKTFFVKQGQFINGIEVWKIQKDQVILRYQNEAMELR